MTILLPNKGPIISTQATELPTRNLTNSLKVGRRDPPVPFLPSSLYLALMTLWVWPNDSQVTMLGLWVMFSLSWESWDHSCYLLTDNNFTVKEDRSLSNGSLATIKASAVLRNSCFLWPSRGGNRFLVTIWIGVFLWIAILFILSRWVAQVLEPIWQLLLSCQSIIAVNISHWLDRRH